MLPTWSNKFSINHKIIDEQHKELFALAHRAYKVANGHTTREEIKLVVTSFFEYMKKHFRDEEQYMYAIKYPKLEEHRQYHRKIVFDMANMVKNSHSANELKEQLMAFAKDWLLTHILQEDMQIEKWRQGSTKNNAQITYTYTCACPNREHKLAESMHLFIQNSKQGIRCKDCKQIIILQNTCKIN